MDDAEFAAFVARIDQIKAGCRDISARMASGEAPTDVPGLVPNRPDTIQARVLFGPDLHDLLSKFMDKVRQVPDGLAKGFRVSVGTHGNLPVGALARLTAWLSSCLGERCWVRQVASPLRKSEVPWGEAWVNEELPAAPVIYSQEVRHEATQLFVYSSTGSRDTGFVIICDCGERFTGRRDVSAEVVNKFREHVLCEIAARG